MRYTLNLNGKDTAVEADDPDMPLVFVLRDLLGLRGTKYTCLEGACGACTVHIYGVAVRACQIPVSDCEGAAIVTIEGLSTAGDHPVQQAWLEERVPQCGWCQPGQIMQAAALIAEDPAPSEEDIATGMSGNLCRCGTAPRILKAVARAAEITRRDAQ
ncbi:Isoquinoline 1-oxidoreductase alpha subunit (plasmid) [Rhodovulum sp. P5]|uniref:(2Fe-2S)-binding protein n=1 Tax=Rhodovulum sp. P5 TaxID=1564506 RepID=UPI0009C1F0B0|nr:(2Fe-2S)-binding protein [Rhodovulum sp. P5]ARE42270.1 Isoquinoline 1-oxidoreductase alpha subunit [Rhodovulum sp. P5]ARE42388.1 Isoquinoline 1-oxidoreductase alpha subunit [Rhodovulum sp. P5]